MDKTDPTEQECYFLPETNGTESESADAHNELISVSSSQFMSVSSSLFLSATHSSKTAVKRLESLLEMVNRGVMPELPQLKETLLIAVEVLSAHNLEESEEYNLKGVSDLEVRRWLSTTFTRHSSVYSEGPVTFHAKQKFKAAANTIMIGRFFESIIREAHVPSGYQCPEEVTELFEEQLDKWEFEIFRLESLSPKHVLRDMGYEVFKRHNLFDMCKISPSVLDKFLIRIETEYGNHNNSYHNATHAADVVQTLHYLIQCTGLKKHLKHLEILSLILSAIIHDVDHPGTSNSFQITTMSSHALMYNDRSVLENHHLHCAFKLLQQHDILAGLSQEEFKVVRTLVIEMVLATDMSTHFDLIKRIKHILSNPNCEVQLLGQERPAMFCLYLHLSDISHPGKAWREHNIWSERLCVEFFQQGDLERNLQRSISPLCDRENTNVPESQLGFIEYIVAPCYDVCAEVLQKVISKPTDVSHDLTDGYIGPKRMWHKHIEANRAVWRSKCIRKSIHSKSTESSCHDNSERHSNRVQCTVEPKVVANRSMSQSKVVANCSTSQRTQTQHENS